MQIFNQLANPTPWIGGPTCLHWLETRRLDWSILWKSLDVHPTKGVVNDSSIPSILYIYIYGIFYISGQNMIIHEAEDVGCSILGCSSGWGARYKKSKQPLSHSQTKISLFTVVCVVNRISSWNNFKCVSKKEREQDAVAALFSAFSTL